MSEPNEQRATFFTLVDDVCQELGYPPRSSRPEADEVVAMEMELDHYPFAVVHSLLSSPHRILIECRFGPLPAADQLEVMQRLLQLNYALADAGECIFCIEPDTGAVIFTKTCELDTFTGRDLLGQMTQMSWQAAQWNQHRFLDNPSEPQSSDFPADFGALA